MRIAHQGTTGAYSEEALVQHFGDLVARVALPSFEDVFDAVAAGRVDAGVVPIENSLAGSVLETYDLLLEHELQVVGEIDLAVRHCLLAPRGTSLSDVRHCYSHPQALRQCARFLAEHEIEPRAAANTAVAARDLAAAPAPGDAAIASARAGAIHGLEVLAADIQTRHDNTTRFFVVQAGRPKDLPASKASLAFATRNEPGALLACLEAIAAQKLNLTKLESRPTGDALWEYTFYADIEAADRGQLDAERVVELLRALADRVTHARLIGRYPRASAADSVII
ncbi:MAG: prephenate dehydratase [Thermoleophilia bacterium]|nr:prephenate dehydratase [Thermoleophilia bacterium]